MATMKIVGMAHGHPSPFDGQYLVEYDPDRPGVDPSGNAMLAHIVCTPDPAQARVFASSVDAWAEWRRTSATTPTRPDGKPNRPLTAFTVEIA